MPRKNSNRDTRIRVGLLGGAFDPPTMGHLMVARCALDNGVLDQVWFVPCFSHKFGKEMTSPEHRLYMCKLATKGDNRLGVFDYEIEHRMTGSTYDFVKRVMVNEMMARVYKFYLVIGQDNANCFNKWVKHRELRKLIPFVVVSRKGLPEEEHKWYGLKPHIYLKGDTGVPEISSTAIRDRLAFQDRSEIDSFVKENVPSDVVDYIKKHRLYGLK